MPEDYVLLILCRHFRFVHFSPEEYQIHLKIQSFSWSSKLGGVRKIYFAHTDIIIMMSLCRIGLNVHKILIKEQSKQRRTEL